MRMTHQRALELSASVATLSGQYAGSTTVAGASCYAVATFLWVLLTMEGRLWGLMPLNVVSGLITANVLWTLA